MTGRRRLAAVAAALVLAAAALQGAAGLAWATGTVDAVGRGRVAVTATGADLVPSLTAAALLALAGVAAAVALAGVARRALGAVLAAVAVWLTVAVAGLLIVPPDPADLAALRSAPLGAAPVPGSVSLHAGIGVGGLGALALLAAGVVLAAARDLPRLGGRYRAAAVGPRPDTRDTDRADPDRAAWDALDAGRDPTIAPVRSERTDGGGAGGTA